MTTPRLVMTPGTCGGDPRLDGHRLTVDVLTSRFAGGESIESIAQDYDITVEAVTVAIRGLVRAARGQRGILAPVDRRLRAACGDRA